MDAATGGLQPGRLTLVAAAPNVGGSLLGLAAARQTTLVDRHTVLYAASGPNRDDIFRRIISAETGGDYPRLKQGRLTAQEQQVARQLVQAGDLLMIDDGTNLRAEDIAETAPHMEGLALVVVDRLQAAHSARLPLSGERLPDASQILAGLARTLHVPVLAVVDIDDPTLLALLDADVVVTLTATADLGKVQRSGPRYLAAPAAGYRCTHATDWVALKSRWQLCSPVSGVPAVPSDGSGPDSRRTAALGARGETAAILSFSYRLLRFFFQFL
ncbi:DnaB-like helicase C-terminal domain-containing protein [Streptomyces sp. NPDC058676]|uniref:DnaB-like helicase C-terminal domain-containing protein n=1 Tax=Streptomyces sp. NPDC058676 TaxID=3346593 RepID=UPI00366A3079